MNDSSSDLTSETVMNPLTTCIRFGTYKGKCFCEKNLCQLRHRVSNGCGQCAAADVAHFSGNTWASFVK